MSPPAADGLVSVVIPTFNRRYCLENAISSVLRQTYAHIEIIVVDDGSTDGTGKWIAGHYADEPRVHYLYQPNQGVCRARNRGLEAARGEFIALLDSDDIWLPWKLELQVATLRQFPHVGMVWTDMDAVNSEGVVLHRKYLRDMYSAYQWFSHTTLFSYTEMISLPKRPDTPVAESVEVGIGDIYSAMIMGNLVHTSTVVLRRERLRQVGGFDASLRYSGEDYDFHLRTCREGPVAFLDTASILYRKGNEDQLTGRRYHRYLAENFYRTVTRAIAQDRDRITLSTKMRDRVLADANAWVGEELINHAELGAARPYLRRALRHDPRQKRVWLLLASTLLPMALRERVREWRRRRAAMTTDAPRTAQEHKL